MRKTNPSIIAFLLFASLALGCTSEPTQAERGVRPGSSKTKTARSAAKSDRPNVVVVTIDTLRPDYLGFHGYPREAAPFLAKIAEQSTVFDEAKSTSSWTAPATASLFTALYPHQHGVLQGFKAYQAKRFIQSFTGEEETITVNRFRKNQMLMPHWFKQLGYKTYGFAANINIGNEIGFHRGFDRFERQRHADAKDFYKRLAMLRDKITGAGPYFLYLHLNDVHEPYHRRRPFYEKDKNERLDLRARYLSEISYLDKYLKKIYELFDMSRNTIVAIVSDHGEEFWDHGRKSHGPWLYRELSRVLMLFHSDDFHIARQRVQVNVSHVDVLPTLLELAGGSPPKDAEGTSLLPVLQKTEKAPALLKQLADRTLFAHRVADRAAGAELWAAFYRRWKLIENRYGKFELYDHAEDPTEQKNLAATNPPILKQLKSDLEAFEKRVSKPEAKGDRQEVPLDDQLLKQLKTLGYVQ
jgi:arylsulfatase A-like enzyme